MVNARSNSFVPSVRDSSSLNVCDQGIHVTHRYRVMSTTVYEIANEFQLVPTELRMLKG
jgi:hypothetical protein